MMEYRLTPGRRIALAVAALTPLRVRVSGETTRAELRAAAAFYPLVGLLVGLCPAAALLLPLPAPARAVVALAAWVVASGGRPLAGWAACCDAAFAPPGATAEETRRRRLAAVRAPVRGTAGTAGVVLVLLARLTALVMAPAAAPLVAATLGRWSMVHALRTYPPAREGRRRARTGEAPLGEATAIATPVLFLLTLSAQAPVRTAVAVVIGTLVALCVAELLASRLGGVNQAVTGTVCEAAELSVLWTFVG
jgi:cobalamin synthase